jgi:hypothetical protein
MFVCRRNQPAAFTALHLRSQSGRREFELRSRRRIARSSTVKKPQIREFSL